MINRLELVEALKALLPGVETSASTTSDIFIFDGKWIKTGNTKLSISYSFPSDTNISGGVKAKELYKILTKMSDEAVTLKNQNDTSLLIKDSITKLQLNFIQDEVTDRIINNKKLARITWEKLPDNFSTNLNLCMYSAAQDQNNGIWNTVYINGKDMVSTDNVRVSWAHLKKAMPEFMLSVNAIVEILKLEPTEYCIDSTWAHFKNSKKNIIFSTRLVMAEYPIQDLKDLFEKETSSKEYVFPEALTKSLSRVSVLSYKDGYIDLSYDEKEGALIVKGEREYASIKDKIKISRGTFPSKKVLHIAPEFLISIMFKTRAFKLVGNVILFELEDYKHIIALYIPEGE